ncbi:hypothetical protein BJX70DRAFT_358784 [Aspergillus crustosus]
MSSTKPVVVVTGATGGQGGSVVDALLASGQSQYQIRAVLRNLTPEKTKPLQDRGVEIVKGDLDDKSSLVEAFKGAHAIFAVTDFFEPFMKYGPEEAEKRELIQATNLAEAAAETAGLSHYIWSTLPSSAKLSKYHTPHFESKATADEHILNRLPELAAKTTFLWVSYYASNLTFPLFTPNLIKTSRQYGWVQPVGPSTPITTIGDQRKNVGLFVEEILRQPQLSKGRYVLAEVETLTQGEVLERWGKVTGNSTVYIPTSLETFDKLFPAWGLEMGVMLQYWEAVGAKSWSKPGVSVLKKEDLGIDASRLVGFDDALVKIDWTQF